ncbi:hypothetical protein TH53_20955 [Pedobacter lusitanus]|uniref:VOC domain-containing protein n=1 Tax=Pedobacter lusitanus TaxID=1503925 RepID=A0A0D0GH59_9SPHI|nr:VOC family protein [Pedobacter lusitanus]KIO75440.1 hypothetical protein TH53_20955 [Pedobacter lusitanus]
MSFSHAVSWFEIPANDINRSQKFYETIFDMQMIPMDMPGFEMRMFPIIDPMVGVGGALAKSEGFHEVSSNSGTLVYLNANPDVQIVLDRIEAAGGKILVPKTEISPEYGYMGIFLDTEGNRVGLHSIPQGA